MANRSHPAMSQTETVEDQSWQIEQIEAAVALSDSPQAKWVTAANIDEWLTSWGSDQEHAAG